MPDSTKEQIDKLTERTGMTITQLVIVAIDRIAQETKAKEEETHAK